jgi:hypothetical protein
MPRGMWTTRTLRALMDERDRRYTERYEAQERALAAALLSAKEAVAAALAAAKEAVLKAELSVDSRLELLNELRTGVATVEQLNALEKVVDDLAKRIDRSEGRGAGVSAMWGWIAGAVGTVTALITLILLMVR